MQKTWWKKLMENWWKMMDRNWTKLILCVFCDINQESMKEHKMKRLPSCFRRCWQNQLFSKGHLKNQNNSFCEPSKFFVRKTENQKKNNLINLSLYKINWIEWKLKQTYLRNLLTNIEITMIQTNIKKKSENSVLPSQLFSRFKWMKIMAETQNLKHQI